MLLSLVLFLAIPPWAQKCIDQLPVWEADVLAQYEGAELTQVNLDMGAVLLDPTELNVNQLHEDWEALEALDQLLEKRHVI